METITFGTYPPLTLDDGSVNENYDDELREFEVPKEWVTRWLDGAITLEEFLDTYTWDESYFLYQDAIADHAVISDNVVLGWEGEEESI